MTAKLTLRGTTKQHKLIPIEIDGPLTSLLFFTMKFESNFTEELDFSEIQFEQKIGEGSFGSVHRAKWRGLTVAVKAFFFKEDFEQERHILKYAIPDTLEYQTWPNVLFKECCLRIRTSCRTLVAVRTRQSLITRALSRSLCPTKGITIGEDKVITKLTCYAVWITT